MLLFTLPATFLLLPARLAAAEAVDYARDVKPVLKAQCYSCHGAREQKGKLRVDTVTLMMSGGRSGASIVPGKSDDSLLLEKITHGPANKRMPPPPKAPLTDKQVTLLKAWIDQGAKAPDNEKPDDPRDHWAFQTPKRMPEPVVKNAMWPRNGIDRFILARLEKEGLTPSPEADRITLIRRLSLDLLGLPPSPKEVDDFLADQRADAYERLVDRLLSSSHYGERFARLWLDQARYADSNGYTIDSARSIWKYRDWVIDAINKDKPFDTFTIEQLAGDLLPGATMEQKIATGFHRNTQINEEGGIDREQFRVESVVDRVNTTGSVFLGLTVGCCQCHDHKFDPISTKEYYQLFAFLNSADEPLLEVPAPGQLEARAKVRAQIAELEKKLKVLDSTTDEAQIHWEENVSDVDRERLPEEIRNILAIARSGRSRKQEQTLKTAFRRIDQSRHVVAGLGDPYPYLALAHLQALAARGTLEIRIIELKAAEPKVVTTMVMQERKTPRLTTIHIQGDFTRKGDAVTPGTPSVLHALKVPRSAGLNRLDLAKWIVDPNNPLTPRVAMNRYWQHYFGTGLVETENDFGTQGTPPSHPELLDWLATEFIAQKWSMKAMHRLIVTSATYRQSSKHRADLLAVDARNRLLARQSRLRLDAEIVRDTALTSSGLLTPTIGGPSVFPPQPEGVYLFTQVRRDWKANTDADRYRRGMYTYFWRSAPHPGLTVFDAPDAATTCTRRNRSNTPLQALTLLNDQAYFEFAQALATRILKEAKDDNAERIQLAFRLCLARTPSEREERRLKELLAQQIAAFEEAPESEAQLFAPKISPKISPRQQAAWTMVARVLMNLDEFVTRE
ncbi:MAG: DUF1553 domain-containing protein [Gemmataceae bacterium]|nr:DUF1553 domain-containing protein [Gemmataceae bacterium]